MSSGGQSARGRRTAWRKSTYSGAGNQCVEVGGTPDGVVVRDSRRPGGARLAITRTAWASLVAEVSAGTPAR